MAKQYKLNVFEVLKRADRQDFDWFDNLSADEQKEFSPWLIQRWVSSKKLNLTNEITNPFIGTLPPDLLWRLFCAMGIEGTTGYKFPKPGKNLSNKANILTKLVTSHYQVSTRIAEQYIPLLSKEDFMKLAEHEALDDPDVKKLKAYLKKHYAKK